MSRKIVAYFQLTHPWAITIVMIATALFGLLAAGRDPDVGRFVLLQCARARTHRGDSRNQVGPTDRQLYVFL